VSSAQFVCIRLVEHVCVGDTDDMRPTGRRYYPDTHEPLTPEQAVRTDLRCSWEDWAQEMKPYAPVLREYPLGTVGYKSDKCPSHCNWDLYCVESDLVFLRLEDSDAE
jgi:hypothetical protein